MPVYPQMLEEFRENHFFWKSVGGARKELCFLNRSTANGLFFSSEILNFTILKEIN